MAIKKLTFYNTLTRRTETLEPRTGNKIDIFVCGPTVYDMPHIGHGRVFTIFDGIVKTLRHNGFQVKYLQNITDIDDKIIERARQKNETARSLARRFEKEYLKDMKALKINSIDIYARASDHIEEILNQTKKLIQKNIAYTTSSGVYFEVRKFNEYGKLSGQNLNAIRDNERIEHDPEKKNPQDFVLWKKSKPGEPKWSSPWGEGRPGWHIEDTAIAEKYFGQQYDMHGGALDLIFPHHECEIAQMEAVSGKKPYVNIWLHAGFLNVRGEKMSKSLGNIISLRDLLSNYSAETFRLLVFQAHYRTPIDYDEDLMKQAESASNRLAEFNNKINQYKDFSSENETLRIKIDTTINEFWQALRDDFDTPHALAVLFSLIKDINPLLNNKALPKKEILTLKQFLKEINNVLSIITTKQKIDIPQDVKNLANERELFRKEKRWREADETRKQLAELGWIIEDTSEGPKLKKL